MYQITNIIYIYFIIVIMIIFFNIGCVIYRKSNKKINTKKYEIYKIKIKENDSKYFIKKLKYPNNLIVYLDVIKQLEKEDSKKIKLYLKNNLILFQILAHKYSKKNSMKKAFYAHVLYELPVNLLNSNIESILLEFIYDNSIYCRANTMMLICKYGNIDMIIKSLKNISKRNLYYNRKLVENHLLIYNKRTDSLIKELLLNINLFTLEIQIAVINYVKHKSGNYCKEIYELYGKLNKEVDLEIIRYFGKYYYEPMLLQLLKLEEQDYLIVATKALSIYDKKYVHYFLIDNLSSPNWYVRKNSAYSLSKMKLSKLELKEIKNLKDKYGKEMIDYVLNEEMEEEVWIKV